MKLFFASLFIFFVINNAVGQNDTVIIFLDSDEKPCPETKAIKYSVQHKEMDRWKKIVFNYEDDQPLWAAYFKDPECKIFDGLFTAFYKNKKLNVTGRYINNKKTGVWKGFTDDGKLIDSAFYQNGFISGTALKWYSDGTIRDSLIFETGGNGVGKGFWADGKPRDHGNFKEGKKNGQWIYFFKNGMKCQEVYYQSDSAISFTCYDEKGNIQTDKCYYEKEAIYKGGDKAWLNFLLSKLKNAKYPESYFDGKVYGTVYVLFVVNPEGKIEEIKLLNSIDPDLDEIALKIIRESPRWEPAIQYNRKVKAYRKQPITFSKVEH